jgi:hypothetical protein
MTTHHLELYNFYERVHPAYRKEHFVGNGWYVCTKFTFDDGRTQTLRRDYGLDKGGALLAVACLSAGKYQS